MAEAIKFDHFMTPNWTIPTSHTTDYSIDTEDDTSPDYSTQISREFWWEKPIASQLLERVIDSEIFIHGPSHWRRNLSGSLRTRATHHWSFDTYEFQQERSLDPLLTTVYLSIPSHVKDMLPEPQILFKKIFELSGGIRAGNLSMYIQVASIINSIVLNKEVQQSIYTTEDNGIVLDFSKGGDRVISLLRNNYAHIMGIVGGEETDVVYEGTDYSTQKVVEKLEKLL